MKLIDLIWKVVEGVCFYQDVLNDEALFAEFVMGSGVKYFDRLESSRFKAYLRMKALDVTDEEQILNADTAIQYIRDHFLYQEEAEKVDVYIRTAGDLQGGIEYSLKDSKQRVVVIDKDGWKLTNESRYKFLHSSASKPQVVPEMCEKNPIDLLKPYVNLKGDSLILFVVWLIQAFCAGNHFALLVTAERGAGKSTLCRIIRSIIEPSGTDISHFSKKKDDLLNILSNLYLVCFDNVRDISKEQSDLLCSAITGGTATKRALYTDNDMFVQKLHNTVVVNGISTTTKESDLAERFLVLKLKKLPSNKICRERDFWDSFNRDLPNILGAIFATLSKAMIYFETLSLKNMPRMADAFADMVIIAQTLGISEEKFRQIYDDNVTLMNQLRSETPIVKAVRDLMNSKPGQRAVEGTAEEIFNMIRSSYSGDPNDLPADASHFTHKVDLEHDNLAAANFRVLIDDTFQKSTRIKIIRKKK